VSKKCKPFILSRTSVAATENYRPVLSSERALQNNKPQLSKRKCQGERKIGRRVPDGRLTPRRTGRLIVGRNVTLIFITFFCFYFMHFKQNIQRGVSCCTVRHILFQLWYRGHLGFGATCCFLLSGWMCGPSAFLRTVESTYNATRCSNSKNHGITWTWKPYT
jgi:hypothetical protein